MDSRTILSELKKLLDVEFPGLIGRVILYGSQATGEANEDSDFDVLVITRYESDWRMKEAVMNVCYRIDLKYDVVTDVKILAENELRTIKGRQPYIREAFSTGVTA